MVGEMIVTEIGTVERDGTSPIRLKIHKKFWDASINVHLFSHLIVLWWISENDSPENRQHLADVPPSKGAENSGIFASRSPNRPSPIGHTIVHLLGVDEESYSLLIDQIDAFDGTPIIDIKPYLPSSDRVDVAKVPPWFKDLKKRYTH